MKIETLTALMLAMQWTAMSKVLEPENWSPASGEADGACESENGGQSFSGGYPYAPGPSPDRMDGVSHETPPQSTGG